jgi:hypothetical protein
MRWLLVPLGLVAALSLGCSEEEPPPVKLLLTPGQEGEAFTRAPAPERLVLRAISTTGKSSDVLNVRWPSSAFELGDFDREQMVAFEALGQDAAGQTVVRGATIYHALWGLTGTLPVFLGRVRETSRPAGLLPIAHEHGLAAIVDARFIVSVGGTAARRADGSSVEPTAFAAYDLGAWSATTVSGTLPRNPRSLVMLRGQYGLAIDDGGASWFDFATFASSEATAPEGMSFSEVSGGAVFYGERGEVYVVGATRAGAASTAVLRVDWDGGLDVIRLGSARAGVAATYVPGRGLLLAGGHATDPGVLLLSPEATSIAPLAYPSDGVEGAAAAVVGEERVMLVGGKDGGEVAPVRVIDLRCTGGCLTKELAPELERVDIQQGWARGTGDDEMVVVGSRGEDPQTRLVRIGGLLGVPTVQEVALRDARMGAAAVALFGRTVALVGGRRVEGEGALGVEVYVPE